MALAYPPFRPALRTVDVNGTQLRAPIDLHVAQGAIQTSGLWLRTWDVDYSQEILGEVPNLSYALLWKFLGFRPTAKLSFALVETEATGIDFGLTLLRKLHTEALSSETYSALQFTLFYKPGGGTVWRGMLMQSTWHPVKVASKYVAGLTIDFDLKARDLITAPGDWSQGAW
jgi:hypothetical protein